MRTFGVLFYTAFLVLIGTATVAFGIAFSIEDMQADCIGYVNYLLYSLQQSTSLRYSIVLAGSLLVIISFYFAQSILAKFQREKTIAFSTASGEVTISLSAVEDLIKRITALTPEIKESRPDVVASKKGIAVDMRIILRSEANIPELTSRLQELIRTRLQEILGVDEQILVRIHVAKILTIEERQRKKDKEETKEETIPFGYGRV